MVKVYMVSRGHFQELKIILIKMGILAVVTLVEIGKQEIII